MSTEQKVGNWVAVVVAWLLVAIPLTWGVYRTLRVAIVLFK